MEISVLDMYRKHNVDTIQLPFNMFLPNSFIFSLTEVSLDSALHTLFLSVIP